jgi:DNA-binding transcriptional regulator YhcF (GntR family)
MTLSAGRTLSQAKSQIAKVLLKNAGDASLKRQRLNLRDMASLLGVEWETVHKSLESLKNEGAIRLERHRIIINKELLNKLVSEDKISKLDAEMTLSTKIRRKVNAF